MSYQCEPSLSISLSQPEHCSCVPLCDSSSLCVSPCFYHWFPLCHPRFSLKRITGFSFHYRFEILPAKLPVSRIGIHPFLLRCTWICDCLLGFLASSNFFHQISKAAPGLLLTHSLSSIKRTSFWHTIILGGSFELQEVPSCFVDLLLEPVTD